MNKKMQSKEKKNIWNEIVRSRYLYLGILPFFIWLIVTQYIPMGGAILAFKDYKIRLGILGSEWVGLKHFKRILITSDAIQSIINTLEISLGRLIFEFPVPIIVALLLTEMPGKKGKRIYQTILTFPHFLSWVVVSNILINFFSSDGAINQIITMLGGEGVAFLANKKLFRPLIYATSLWKGAGWSAIIYMAAITGIDTSLYEAAQIDGASRLRQIWHITLTGIKPTIVVMFILQVGSMMNAGFDQLFNLQNDAVASEALILDTYIHRITFETLPNYGFSAAVGLFKGVINFVLLIIANKVVGLLSGEKLFA